MLRQSGKIHGKHYAGGHGKVIQHPGHHRIDIISGTGGNQILCLQIWNYVIVK